MLPRPNPSPWQGTPSMFANISHQPLHRDCAHMCALAVANGSSCVGSFSCPLIWNVTWPSINHNITAISAVRREKFALAEITDSVETKSALSWFSCGMLLQDESKIGAGPWWSIDLPSIAALPSTCPKLMLSDSCSKVEIPLSDLQSYFAAQKKCHNYGKHLCDH